MRGGSTLILNILRVLLPGSLSIRESRSTSCSGPHAWSRTSSMRRNRFLVRIEDAPTCKKPPGPPGPQGCFGEASCVKFRRCNKHLYTRKLESQLRIPKAKSPEHVSVSSQKAHKSPQPWALENPKAATLNPKPLALYSRLSRWLAWRPIAWASSRSQQTAPTISSLSSRSAAIQGSIGDLWVCRVEGSVEVCFWRSQGSAT